jgi:hypothetical protein
MACILIASPRHKDPSLISRFKILLPALLLCHTSYAQQLKGLVKEYGSLYPVPNAHIIASGSGTLTNDAGYFIIPSTAGDTVTISHVGYETFYYVPKSIPRDTVMLLLIPKSFLLNEVTISPHLREEQLKRVILETPVELSREEENLLLNLENTRILFRMGYQPEMTNMDNFRMYMKGPQDVTFLSSDPSRGLIRALKNIGNRPPVRQSPPGTRSAPLPASLFFRRPLIVKDSVSRDSVSHR